MSIDSIHLGSREWTCSELALAMSAATMLPRSFEDDIRDLEAELADLWLCLLIYITFCQAAPHVGLFMDTVYTSSCMPSCGPYKSSSSYIYRGGSQSHICIYGLIFWLPPKSLQGPWSMVWPFHVCVAVQSLAIDLGNRL